MSIFKIRHSIRPCMRLTRSLFHPTINYSTNHDEHYFNKSEEYQSRRRQILYGLTATIGVAYCSWKLLNSEQNKIHAAKKVEIEKSEESQRVLPNLPIYKQTQVAEHYDKERKIWVTMNRGVYDVTDFIDKHPGGDRLLMAAGGSLEPFWELYPIHQRKDVFEILEKYRIGNLAEEDKFKLESSDQTETIFKNEPRRHPCFITRSARPFNGETPPPLLTQQFYTPNEVFYIRNHLPVPEIDLKNYEVQIEGINIKPNFTISLSELKKLPRVSRSVTIQCGGNRRSEMGIVRPVAGLQWSGGAIGTALWTGVRLKDVLKKAGFNPQSYKNQNKLHIQFEGLDSDQSGECYGASFPFQLLLDDNFDPILAFEMNGEELPLDHGFPLRIIVPGIVGARSVKWLKRIVISDEENQSPWQQRDYKIFSPSVTMETVDFSSAPAIMDTPPTSYIASHGEGERLISGTHTLSGYAFSGGGRKIARVEISIDKGATWKVTDVLEQANDEGESIKNWAWALWQIKLNLTKKGPVEVWVKAVDNSYNQQAENFGTIYNYRGLLANAIHKLKLNIV